MRYEVEVGGRTRQVALSRVGDAFAVTVDGREWRVDAVRIDAHTLSLLVDSVWPNETPGSPHAAPPSTPAGLRPGYEVSIAPDRVGGLTVCVGATPVAVALDRRRRWGRTEDAGAAGTGPQRLVAPMPGKVVRVLVGPGEAVRARQSLVVVEAMKMENELRAGRDGTVAEVHAREGASVDAGALLIVIQ
jgi:biotin carboxyl carrier protein